MSSETEHLSDVVARRIVLFRKRRGMTRETLAAACAKVGYPELTGPALANIETGRRGPEGQRRRDVTVDELIVLAAALDVPPLLLLFPVGDKRRTAMLPGQEADTWTAATWFTGEAEDERPSPELAALQLHRQLDTAGDREATDAVLAEMRRHGIVAPLTSDLELEALRRAGDRRRNGMQVALRDGEAMVPVAALREFVRGAAAQLDEPGDTSR